MNKAAILVAIFFAPLSAQAKTVYVTYDGPDAEQMGAGGTRQDMRGVELWTSGAPAKRFVVLGIITDDRKDRLLDGDPTDSPAIAKKAKEAGGDALILLGQNSSTVGFIGGGSAWSNGASTFSSGQGRVVNRRVTRFAVIRYLAAK